MSPPAEPKAKRRDLERVRQNQRRSRQRKQAYVLELESKVARLSAQLAEAGRPAVAAPEEAGSDEATLQTLKRENDARHDLLLALGVATSAQDLFVRASAMRVATMPPHLATNNVTILPRHANNNVDTPAVDDWQSTSHALASADAFAFAPLLDASTDWEYPVTIDGLPQHQHQGLCTSVWNAPSQAVDASLTGTTACSIAFSMILQHNARSLPMAQLESRLRIGYCVGQTIGGDCRVANSVLFSVLAEIS